MDINYITWFIIGVISVSLPVFFMKTYTETNNIVWIILSVFAYLVLILSYSVILVDQNPAIIYAILKISSILLVTFFALLIYGNKLNLKSSIGILLGLISIYLLSSA
ncbi:MAG: hypothetical protein Terrestrivirus1_23 [Terrestrivirus sp.]|uniref:EamA domain-containing protein n=1 Tax=Terrestrivirus sp. TaxID=2487775 RepID=A0A3G4ZNV2_9VIRU|nr:MAG: hypothetical protein Terrestrivirus1_23 [Terrestrivirus sp.]